MILFDALFINKGGGKVLLETLLERLSNNDKILFLLDERIRFKLKNKPKNAIFLYPSIFKRHHFYNKHNKEFEIVFCFGNFPPTFKLNCIVYTYFQNLVLIDNDFLTFKLRLKQLFFKMINIKI